MVLDVVQGTNEQINNAYGTRDEVTGEVGTEERIKRMPLVRNKKCTGGNIPNMSKTQEICKEKVQNYITVQTTKRINSNAPEPAGRKRCH